MELVLTGDPITAERGYELGLVNRLTDPGGAVAGALELARSVAANGPLALAASKRIMSEAPGWPEDEFWQLYNGGAYRALKSGYDPQGRLPDLHEKCVRGR